MANIIRKPVCVVINKKAYRIRVPTGYSKDPEKTSEWDIILRTLGDSDNLLHWSYIWSWCQEPVSKITSEVSVLTNTLPVSHSALRGCTTAQSRSAALQIRRAACIGFRPVLEPVDPETFETDKERYANMPDGARLSLGTLYMDNKPIPIPKHPSDIGDIPNYIPGADLRIGETDLVSANQIRWIKCGHIFICDRNLLKKVSWSDLDKMGLIYGDRSLLQTSKLPNLSSTISNHPATQFVKDKFIKKGK